MFCSSMQSQHCPNHERHGVQHRCLDPLLLKDYGRVLGLHSADVGVLRTFMDLWDKLRVCCGAQMSEDYRMRLVPDIARKFKTSLFGSSSDGKRIGNQYGNRRSKRRATGANERTREKSSDKCEEYDFDAIEQALMSTAVFKTCGHSIALIQRLSSRDLPLDGTYCSRSRAAAIKNHFRFNDKRYKHGDY